MKLKWEKNHPGAPLHIIYFSPDDLPNDEKFKVLEKVDNQTLIWIVGHHFYKKNAYALRNNAGIDFDFSLIGLHLLRNIKNPTVRCDRQNEYDTNLSLQKLKIVIAACNTGVGLKDNQGKENKADSFAGNLANFLWNGDFGYYLNCQVVGTRGFLIPCMGSNSIINFFIFMIKHGNESSFHKRYMFTNKMSGKKSAISFFPAHQPKDYKIVFEISPENSQENIQEGQIKPQILSITEKRKQEQQQNQELKLKLNMGPC